MRKNEIISISKNKSSYTVTIAAGTKGEDIMNGLSILIRDIVKHEQQINPSYTSNQLLRGVEICLRYLEEKQ